MTCANCGRPATIHLTEIRDGNKTERHLCQACAATGELDPSRPPTPVGELLAKFVREHGPKPDGDRK